MRCFISLLGHLTYICMPLQASSHQIHAARFSSQYEASSSGVQKCGRALAARDQKRGVRERFFPFILHEYECCMTSLYVCAIKNCCALLHSQKILHPCSSYKILITHTFCNSTLWITALDIRVHRLVPGNSIVSFIAV